MPFHPELSITGLQELQQRNLRWLAELKPSGALGKAVQWGTAEAHRQAVARTHVDTGALRASHRVDLQGTQGRVYIDPGASNPRSGQMTAVYGFYEHARGGDHAFYERTVAEEGARIGREMGSLVKVAIEGA